MSETIGSGPAAGRMPHPGATSPRPGPPPATESDATEAYAFSCVRCGHGWEQAYVIQHHADTSGRTYVTYLADGVEVPSPLTRPSCGNCGGHLVRITRSGPVAAVSRRGTAHQGGHRWHGREHHGADDRTGHPGEAGGTGVRRKPGEAAASRCWRLLHLFGRRHPGTSTTTGTSTGTGTGIGNAPVAAAEAHRLS
ncbi:hypothetical protein [Actinacidiphila yeochonensis]|uniref:hypothetical protein n=1 Tax=Actinacidiphila yeochonensis TaxID=89050 RepID=UPI0018E2B577|nr:hypothetical protein [Actinacidiphila yeochonensis]